MFGVWNETSWSRPCWRTVALFAAAALRKPHGVDQTLNACAKLLPSCVPVMFWLNTPGTGAGAPGTVGGWVGPVARDTRSAGAAGGAKLIVRVYCVICVALTGPSGLPMALLWPNAPLRAVPEKVIEFSVSTPIAFDAAAMTELAFCAAAPREKVTRSAATVSVLSSMRASSTGWGTYRYNLRII